MTKYHLAQLNIALMSAPLDSPVLADFVANLDRINALAERSPGFVWRLQTETGDATALRDFGDDYLVNMSTWNDVNSLFNYVFKSAHIEIMQRRKEWFEKMRDMHAVLWWVPEGHRPTTLEAKRRLQYLQENGPTATAFTFKKPYPAPGTASSEVAQAFDDICPAT